jgi:hypothetical protein
LTNSTTQIGEGKVVSADSESDDDLVMMGQSAKLSPHGSCTMHQLNSHPEVVLLLCPEESIPELTHSLVEQVSPGRCFKNHPLFCLIQTLGKMNLSKTQVYVLTSNTTSQFKCDRMVDDLEIPFLRALKTDSESVSAICPYLEQPNTVAGLAAQGKFYSVILYQIIFLMLFQL